MFGLAERTERAGNVFRCTICNVPVFADTNPENYAAAETREQIAARHCTRCHSNTQGRK